MKNQKNVIMILIKQYGIKGLIGLILLFNSCQTFSQNKLTRKEKKRISHQLDSLSIADQKYRIPILYGTTNQHEIDSMQQLPIDKRRKIYAYAAKSPELSIFRDSLFMLMEKEDKKNYDMVKAIINRYGFPTFYKKDYNILLIIEHSILYDPSYLDTLRQFMFDKKITPWNYAKIYDRYLMLRGNKLLYYTRGKYNNIDSYE